LYGGCHGGAAAGAGFCGGEQHRGEQHHRGQAGEAAPAAGGVVGGGALDAAVAAFAAGGQAAEFAAGGLGSFRVMDSGLLRGGDKGEAVLGLAVGQPVRAVLPVLGDAEPPLVGFRQAGQRLADAGQVQPGDQRGDPAGRPLAVSPPPSEYLMTVA